MEKTDTENKQFQEKTQELEKQLTIKNAIISKQVEQIALLEEHVLHLENKLRKYINENTPSSKKPDWENHHSPDRIDKEKKPIGKPKGSNGGTRPQPEISGEKVIRLEKHETYLGKPINYVERIIGDIPEPSKIKWVKYFLAQYKDPATGNIITATHPECPLTGSYGPNLRAMITLLREKANLSEEQTIEFLNNWHNLEPAPGTIETELKRTATILQPHYDAIGVAINRAPAKHSDETGQSVNGKKWCIYALSTQQLAYFFTEEQKRAIHIQQKLTDDWNKTLICDGHSIYDYWHAKQRCWSHATRKDAWLLEEKETEERRLLHEAISGTFQHCKELLIKKPPDPSNIWDVIAIRNRLWNMLNYAWTDEKCQKTANYMKNGWNNWFLFMLVPGVEPTNNLDERAVRKHVMKRKNCGAFRSVDGLKNHCTILSVLETWRKNEKNTCHTLIDVLKQHNSNISWTA